MSQKRYFSRMCRRGARSFVFLLVRTHGATGGWFLPEPPISLDMFRGLTVVQWVVNCKCSGLQVVECALEGLGGGVVESSSENRAESRVHVGGSGLTLSVANATKAEREADCYVAQHSIRYHHSPHPQPQ